jgi:predicted  nucleic acid-binding Zn-ribbon protein
MPVEKVPSWIKQVLMPELSEIKGELKAIHTRIDSVEAQIGSLRNEMNSKFEGLNYRFEKVDERIASLRTEMNVRLDSLEKRIPVIEELTALKLKIAEIEKRLAIA